MPRKSATPQLPQGLRLRSGKLHFRFMVAGKTYTGKTDLSPTKHNVSAALREMEKARAAVLAGEPTRRLAPRRFNDAADAYLAWKRMQHPDHPSTPLRIETSLVSLRRRFGTLMLHAITPAMIEEYKSARLTEGMQPVTVRHDLHALSGLFQYGVTQRWLLRSPMDEVVIPSDHGAVRDHVVTPAEEAVYFAAARAIYEPFHDAARLVLLLGLRPDEVLSITPADVDLERRRVNVVKGKTRAATRTLALPEEAVEILERRIAASVGPYMWMSERGARRLRVQPYHRRVLAATGLAFTVYELRHTFASRKAERGLDLPTLAAILGHASLRTVGRYVHPSQAAMDAAMLDEDRVKIRSRLTPKKGVSKGPKPTQAARGK